MVLLVHVHSSYSGQIPCVTFFEPYEGYNYGPTNVTCADVGYPNYTLVDCECSSAWSTCNGSTIINDTCYTYPVDLSGGDSRNRASINCCDLDSYLDSQSFNVGGVTNNEEISCTSRFSDESNSTAEVSCNNDEVLFGCMGLSLGGLTQGSCIGSGCADNLLTSPPISGVFNTSDDTCVAVKGGTDKGGNSAFNQGIIAQAICCKIANNDISISCDTKWGDLSDSSDDSLSLVSCGDDTGDIGDYFMTNCAAIKPDYASNSYDGTYFLNEDDSNNGAQYNNSNTTAVCVGWNGAGGTGNTGIYAQALCCKYTTDSPTNAPTDEPTPSTTSSMSGSTQYQYPLYGSLAYIHVIVILAVAIA